MKIGKVISRSKPHARQTAIVPKSILDRKKWRGDGLFPPHHGRT
jgi:hypothetical protein